MGLRRVDAGQADAALPAAVIQQGEGVAIRDGDDLAEDLPGLGRQGEKEEEEKQERQRAADAGRNAGPAGRSRPARGGPHPALHRLQASRSRPA
ncbi:hypothetical protein [Siccirubricoccus phaeus]|uniref:hypothetical protein n=1 Tax=Siccirubricoccus phaeus TaxID=2595053 RepID=UPI001A9C57D3|nr:hypothetical protein [Siccirubricoccus phaeus]